MWLEFFAWFGIYFILLVSVLWALGERNDCFRLMLMVPRFIWCFIWTFVFIFAYFAFLGPFSIFRLIWPRFYWGVEGKLYRWLLGHVGYWGYTAGYSIEEFGDVDKVNALPPFTRCLLIANHQSTGDVPTLMAVLQDKGKAARKAMWIMDIMFRYTPFGCVSRLHGDFFIQSGKNAREKSLDFLRNHLAKVFWDRDRLWIILFPEGGFFCNRVKSSQQYAIKNGYPHLEWVTLPRIGAVKTILDVCGPVGRDDYNNQKHGSPTAWSLVKDTVGAIREKSYIKETRPPLTHLLDVTIVYPSFANPLTLWSIIMGSRRRCSIKVHYQLHDLKDVPYVDESQLQEWLYARFVEKEQLLKNYYETGSLDPQMPQEGHVLRFPFIYIVAQYVFWISFSLTMIRIYHTLCIRALCLLFPYFSASLANYFCNS